MHTRSTPAPWNGPQNVTRLSEPAKLTTWRQENTYKPLQIPPPPSKKLIGASAVPGMDCSLVLAPAPITVVFPSRSSQFPVSVKLQGGEESECKYATLITLSLVWRDRRMHLSALSFRHFRGENIFPKISLHIRPKSRVCQKYSSYDVPRFHLIHVRISCPEAEMPSSIHRIYHL